jgi:hypothetical protein
MLTAHCSLLTTHYALRTTHYALLAWWWSGSSQPGVPQRPASLPSSSVMLGRDLFITLASYALQEGHAYLGSK